MADRIISCISLNSTLVDTFGDLFMFIKLLKFSIKFKVARKESNIDYGLQMGRGIQNGIIKPGIVTGH